MNFLRSLTLLIFVALCSATAALSYPLDNVFIRITDSNGKAVSGGKVYVFTAGTTTPVTTHSCAAMSACTNAHPVVADSGGKIAAIYVPAGSYKIRYTNSAGTTLYEVDNYVVTDIDAINDNNFPVTAKTADYTVDDADDGAVFAVDASAAPGTLVTISAEAQTLGNGFPFCVVNSGSSGTVTITPDAGETINGAASYSIATQYQSACFVSRGASGWFIFAERDPAGTFSTASTFNETVTFNDDVICPQVSLTDAATISWDMSTGCVFRVVLGGNRTLDAPTNAAAGQRGIFRVQQDGTGGRTVTFNSAYHFSSLVNQRPATGASAVTEYEYYVESASIVKIWRVRADSPLSPINHWVEYDLGAYNDDSTQSTAHSLGRYPSAVDCYLEFTTTEHGYAVGDRVMLGTNMVNPNGDAGTICWFNTTNVGYTAGDAIYIVSRSTLNFAVVTETNVKVVVRAYE